MRIFVACMCALLVATAAAMPVAARACEVPPLAGAWENPHASETQDVTRLEIAHACQTHLTGGRAALSGTTWTVRAFSKCAPRDCKWGREAASTDDEGNLVVVFATFSARRTLHIRHAGHAVYLDVDVDYHDARTADRVQNLVLVAAD